MLLFQHTVSGKQCTCESPAAWRPSTMSVPGFPNPYHAIPCMVTALLF